jgi:hypothetical protein
MPDTIVPFNAVSGLTATTAFFTSGVTFGSGFGATGATSSFFSGLDLNFNTLIDPSFRYYNETTSSPSISTNTLTLDLSSAQVFNVSLNANITTLTISNTPSTSNRAIGFTLIFTADGTARTVTWPAEVKWANNDPPSLTSTNNKRDILSFMSPDNGTTWFGFIGGLNF